MHRPRRPPSTTSLCSRRADPGRRRRRRWRPLRLTQQTQALRLSGSQQAAQTECLLPQAEHARPQHRVLPVQPARPQADLILSRLPTVPGPLGGQVVPPPPLEVLLVFEGVWDGAFGAAGTPSAGTLQGASYQRAAQTGHTGRQQGEGRRGWLGDRRPRHRHVSITRHCLRTGAG